jgi:hypothetical protein
MLGHRSSFFSLLMDPLLTSQLFDGRRLNVLLDRFHAEAVASNAVNAAVLACTQI